MNLNFDLSSDSYYILLTVEHYFQKELYVEHNTQRIHDKNRIF